jgi:hypothetical protein
MAPAPHLRSVNELLSVALVMERAAAARYAEIARRMAEREHDDLADLFTPLGRLERDHARFLERRLAVQMAADEAEHIDRIAAALAHHAGRAADRSDPRTAAAVRTLGE